MKDKKRWRGKSARKKMCARGSRWEVIKNYAARGGLWSAEKNGGREVPRCGECHEHLTFLFMVEFVSSLRDERAFPAIAGYEKPEDVRFVIEGRRPWGSRDLVYYELSRALALQIARDPSITESVNRDIIIPVCAQEFENLPRICTWKIFMPREFLR